MFSVLYSGCQFSELSLKHVILTVILSVYSPSNRLGCWSELFGHLVILYILQGNEWSNAQLFYWNGSCWNKTKRLVMKTILNIQLFIFALMLGATVSVGQVQTMDNVRLAVKSGNSNSLSTYFASSVDVKLESQEGIYSGKQAALVLQKFFSQHPASDFKYNHVGSTANQAKHYSIGTYTTKSSSYRVLISYKVMSGQYQIDKIHFDLE